MPVRAKANRQEAKAAFFRVGCCQVCSRLKTGLPTSNDQAPGVAALAVRAVVPASMGMESPERPELWIQRPQRSVWNCCLDF